MEDVKIEPEKCLAKPGERVFLSPDQVLRVVDMDADGSVHTFLQKHQIYDEAVWSRDDLVREMGEAVSMELSGAAARSMRHGVAMVRKDKPSPIFLATNEDRIRQLEAEIG